MIRMLCRGNLKVQLWNMAKCLHADFFSLFLERMLQYCRLMNSEEEESVRMREKRILKLQTMLSDTKKQIIRRVIRMSQNSSNKKNRKNRTVLTERARKANNFIKNAADCFFTLMCDPEILALTTQTDLIEKVEKFKKNVNNACQKMMQNIDDDGEVDRNLRLSSSKSKIQENDEIEDDLEQRKETHRNSPHKSRSKNFKISNEASVSMMEWLLENFENPYPSNEQKQKMAQQGNISMVKVNNWFINARQRTVKSYFCKE